MKSLSEEPKGEAWRVLKIMSEVTNAFDTLSNIGPCVSIFGGARSTPVDPYYKDAETLGKALVASGLGVITGGGPGIMEAANKGAREADGTSVGLHIHLPREQEPNKFLTTRCDFKYFFVRKLIFVKYAVAFVVMPGGIGTLDELFEAYVLAQTNRIKRFPIILYGESFWKPLLSWLSTTLIDHHYLDKNELHYVTLLNSPKEVVEYIKKVIII